MNSNNIEIVGKVSRPALLVCFNETRFDYATNSQNIVCWNPMFKIYFVRLWHQIEFVPCNSIRLETKSCRHSVDNYYTMVTTCVMHFDILYPFCLYLYSIQWLKKSVDKEYILIYWSSNKNSFDKEHWNQKELKSKSIYQFCFTIRVPDLDLKLNQDGCQKSKLSPFGDSATFGTGSTSRIPSKTTGNNFCVY